MILKFVTKSKDASDRALTLNIQHYYSIPKKIYLNKYVDVKKANFTQKPISHSMEKHAAHLSSAYFDFLSRYIKHV